MKLSKNFLVYSINFFLYVVVVKYNKENIYLGFFVDRESDFFFVVWRTVDEGNIECLRFWRRRGFYF